MYSKFAIAIANYARSDAAPAVEQFDLRCAEGRFDHRGVFSVSESARRVPNVSGR